MKSAQPDGILVLLGDEPAWVIIPLVFGLNSSCVCAKLFLCLAQTPLASFFPWAGGCLRGDVYYRTPLSSNLL